MILIRVIFIFSLLNNAISFASSGVCFGKVGFAMGIGIYHTYKFSPVKKALEALHSRCCARLGFITSRV